MTDCRQALRPVANGLDSAPFPVRFMAYPGPTTPVGSVACTRENPMGGDDRNPTAGERRRQTRELVERLLREREQLLVLYCRVAGLEPYHESKGDHLQALLRDFCQILVDYVAAVEFELFSRLTSGRERRQDVLHTANACYPGIAGSDDAVLAFNDKYESLDQAHGPASLAADMSALGDTLASRFELEDRMFSALR